MRHIHIDPTNCTLLRRGCGIFLILGSIGAYLAGGLAEGDTIILFWIGIGLALFSAEKHDENY